MAINTDAPFLLGQRFGPGMAGRGRGRIINVGSQQTVRAFGNSGAYGVSKAAVVALTRSQAEAWSAAGVCCNAIIPGFVETPLTRKVFSDPARVAALAARTMVGRNGVPNDMVGAAIFLASPAASYPSVHAASSPPNGIFAGEYDRGIDPLAWLSAPCVMGVLNVTPDSFSDAGAFLDACDALRRFGQMAGDGAVICDIGAESTRPGAAPVSADEQLRRLEPVLQALSSGCDVAISIDTSSVSVARAALDVGAVLVNDVTAGRGDPDLLPLVAERGAAVCLVHMQGEPQTMQQAPRYDDVASEVAAFLEERLSAAVTAGVPEAHVVLDPGIGFGKRLEDNLALLQQLPRLVALGRPVVVGVSRKGMFGQLLGRQVDERLAGSLAAGLLAIDRGAAVLRVHDIRETADVIEVWRAVRGVG